LQNSIVKLYEAGAVDRALGDAIHPGGLSLTKRIAQVLEISDNWRILDIACGKGTTVDFLSQEDGCHMIGIDLSIKLISMAEDTADFVLGDANSLPFADSAFDAVILECSFSLLLDKEGAAREIGRVLKAGGRLAITDVFLSRQIPAGLKTDVTFAACIAGALKLEEYTRLFEKAGFKGLYVEDHSKELKRAAGQIMTAYGTMRSFIENTGGSSIEEWQRMFREGKPGYALITATKP